MAISKGFRYKDKEGKVTDYEYGVNGSNVTQDSEHRLVTDEEKQTWNDKADLEDIPSGSAASHAVANNCTTTAAGSVLDARQGKVLMDKANQLSSETDRIRVYVGNDGKLHFVNKAGADSVLPFNSFKFLAAVPYNTSRVSGSSIPFDLSAYSGEVIIAFAFIWAYGVSLDTTQITFSPEPEEYLYKAPDAYTTGGSWGYNVPFVIRINVDKISNKTLNVNHKSNGQMRGCQYFIFQI